MKCCFDCSVKIILNKLIRSFSIRFDIFYNCFFLPIRISDSVSNLNRQHVFSNRCYYSNYFRVETRFYFSLKKTKKKCDDSNCYAEIYSIRDVCRSNQICGNRNKVSLFQCFSKITNCKKSLEVPKAPGSFATKECYFGDNPIFDF